MRDLKIRTGLSYYADSWAFNENFKMLQYSGYRTSSISLYIDYGNLSSEYDLEQDCIIEDSRENRIKIQRYMTKEGYNRVSEIEGTLDDLIEDIGGVDYANIEELYELLDDLGIDYTSNYVRMDTRGYSQGDYAEILVNAEEFEKTIGVKFSESDYQQRFDSYHFRDMTIGGTINVSFEYTAKNGVNVVYDDEFNFNEWTNDEYDVDGLMVKNIVEYISQQLPYKLSNNEVAELITALEEIDYTDVKYPCAC